MGAFARRVLGMQAAKAAIPSLDKETKLQARQVLDAHELPYMKRLIESLEAQGAVPIAVEGGHEKMIEQVGRQNAYRVLVALLKKERDSAERVLAQDQARQRQS